MSLQFVLVILIVVYLRRAFQTKIAMQVWHKRLNLILYAGMVAMVLQLVIPFPAFKKLYLILYNISRLQYYSI